MKSAKQRGQTKRGPGRDDTRHTLRQMVARSGSSVVSHLLATEGHALEVQKAHEWAQNPLCLVYEKASAPCFKVVRNRDLRRPFVAISWTWQPSPYENEQSGNYWAEHSNHPRRERLKIRDCVLDRVTNYLRHNELDLELFWIDQVCIDQDNEKAKMKAMNSMDLIYRIANKAIGLLSTPIESAADLDLMTRLMDGELTFQFRSGVFAFCRPRVDDNTIEKIFRMLERLTEDIWWKRAWIFQEEYLAGREMDLLFPLTIRPQTCSDYERIPGEFRVSATVFRKEATSFVKAYQREGPPNDQASCVHMLKIIGRYRLLLQHESKGSMPMSATIHSDLQWRHLKNPWDRLAIAANACDYGIRLDHVALADQQFSASMSLLAQYLLNGEVFVLPCHRAGKAGAAPAMGAVQWMQKTTLKGCKPPDGIRPLSYLKLCRLPNVRFCEEGVRTRGLIWRLRSSNVLPRFRSTYPRMSPACAEWLAGEPWKAHEMKDLIYALKRSRRHREVANKLEYHIQRRKEGDNCRAYAHMHDMMWQLVQAINGGQRLCIGYSRSRGCACAGIFILRPQGFRPKLLGVRRDLFAFTAWQSGNSAPNSTDNFVSLSVDVRHGNVISALGWMNGLVFFRNRDLRDVTFAWPEGWKS